MNSILSRELKAASSAVKGLSEEIKAFGGARRGIMERKAIDRQVAAFKDGVKSYGDGGDAEQKEWAVLSDYLAGRQMKAVPGMKAATVANPGDAGVLATGVVYNRILRMMYNKSAILADCNVIPIEGNLSQIPVELKPGSTSWVGETQPRPESDNSVGMINIPVNKIVMAKSISNDLLADSKVVSFEEYFMNSASDAISAGIGDALVMGSGDRQPVGLFASKRLKTIKSGESTGITTDALMDAIKSVPVDALGNAKWYMSHGTFWDVVKVFGKNSSYVNMPLGDVVGPSILGHEVRFVNAPGIEKSGNICAVFGDLRHAYTVVQRNGVEFHKNPYVKMDQDITQFYFTARLGGDLVMPESVIGIKVGA